MTEPPRRVRFFSGQVLTAEDLAAAQEYLRGMRRLHNRLHGYGTVSGLDVEVGDGEVHVTPGVAIDPLGREIVLTRPLTLCLEGHLAVRKMVRKPVRDLVITWHEAPDAPVPGADGEQVFTRWLEEPTLRLVERDGAGPEDLTLARLSRSRRGGVEVDVSVRRLLGRA